MANYYHDQDRQKSYNRRRKLRKAIAILGLLVFILAIAGGVFIWQATRNRNSGPVVIKQPTKSYYLGAPRRLIQTDRFMFESTDNWQISQEESLAPNKYVFFTHSLNNNLINFELDVIFNKSLDGQPVNYIMPVSVLDGNKLKTDSLSSRCGDDLVSKYKAAAPNTLAMEFHGAKYICAVRGSTEKGAAALIGGSYDIILKRPNSQPLTVNFLFNNSSSSYFGQAFKEVLESFTLK